MAWLWSGKNFELHLAMFHLTDLALSFILNRPPGHHSMRRAASGFCVFNNVAIAAKYAQQKYGVQR